MNDTLFKFIGHLHPLFVHLPIGFLILLGILEGAALLKRFNHLAGSSRVILVVTVPIAAASVVCGWVLSWNNDYDAQLLFWHKWLGTGVGIAALVLLFLHWRGWTMAYRAALLITLGLLTIAGHLGASLTHGSDYLSPAMFFSKPKPVETAAGQSAYAVAIEPVLKQYCYSCHGPSKSKGKLRLDTPDNILKGGDSGPVLVAGSSSQSLLIKRLHLPNTEDEHMPPDAKPQPSADQIALLAWWVDVGAPMDKSLSDLHPPDTLLRVLQSKAGLTR